MSPFVGECTTDVEDPSFQIIFDGYCIEESDGGFFSHVYCDRILVGMIISEHEVTT